MQANAVPDAPGVQNPLPWLDDLLNGVEHTNFFENRVTEYAKAATQGTWDDAFVIHDEEAVA